MAILLALLTVVGGFIAAVALVAADRVMLGIAVGLLSLPVALGIWITANDRA